MMTEALGNAKPSCGKRRTYLEVGRTEEPRRLGEMARIMDLLQVITFPMEWSVSASLERTGGTGGRDEGGRNTQCMEEQEVQVGYGIREEVLTRSWRTRPGTRAACGGRGTATFRSPLRCSCPLDGSRPSRPSLQSEREREPQSVERRRTVADCGESAPNAADGVLAEHVVSAARVLVLCGVRHGELDVCACVLEDEVVAAWMVVEEASYVVYDAVEGDPAVLLGLVLCDVLERKDLDWPA